MPDAQDMELLNEYIRNGSESAFAELVQRHINLVYSVALRHTSNAAHAQEIAQAVFIVLARKAAGLRENTILEGWLYETTRLTALNFLRGERRRQFREQEAYVQSTLQDATDDLLWNQLAPLLDEAMAHLGQSDRDAVILRFFKDKSVRDIAVAMQVSEPAAQRRVLRALDKLRTFLARRGVSATSAIIAGTITANGVQAAPVGLAKTVSAVAISKGAAASTSTLTLIKGALKIMAWTKAKTAIGVGVGVLLAAGTTTVMVEKVAARHLEENWRTLSIQSAEVDRLSPQVAILPTRYKFSGGSRLIRPGIGIDKFVGINVPVAAIASLAYRSDDPLGMPWPRERMIFTTPEPRQKYDFVATLSHGCQEALREEFKRKLGFAGRYETRDTDALVLRVKYANAPKLVPAAGDGYGNFNDTVENGQHVLKCDNQPLSLVAGILERQFGKPVIDGTGLKQHFNLDLRWDNRRGGKDALKEALLNQLGLDLVASKEPVEMLVLEKAN
jgi:RNA polymerase sigma factor (sigma-70 family)